MKKLQLFLLCYSIFNYSNISAMIGGYDHSDGYDHYSQNKKAQFSQKGDQVFINGQPQTEESLKIYRLENALIQAQTEINKLKEESIQKRLHIARKQKNLRFTSIALLAVTTCIAYELIKHKKESTPFQQK